jgi:hypothetical protein
LLKNAPTLFLLQNDELIELSMVNLMISHVDLNGREISKPFGGSQKVRAACSFTIPPLEEVSIFGTSSASFQFLTKLFR